MTLARTRVWDITTEMSSVAHETQKIKYVKRTYIPIEKDI